MTIRSWLAALWQWLVGLFSRPSGSYFDPHYFDSVTTD